MRNYYVFIVNDYFAHFYDSKPSSLFKIFEQIYNLNNNYIWQKNKYKYLLVQSISDNPVEIHLCNPSSKITNGIPDTDSNITSILLNNKSIIIPFNWNYYISGNSNMYGIHDYITICTSVL